MLATRVSQIQVRPLQAVKRTRSLCVRAHKKEEVNAMEKMGVATLLALVLMTGDLVMPQDADAARSGGRAGGSSFAARRAAPRAVPSRRWVEIGGP